MERETQELAFGGHSFTVKSYATARENQAIQRVLLKDAKFDLASGAEAPKLNDFDPLVMFDMNEETVRQMVVTMDGKPENIVERYLDLPSAVAEELVSALNELVAKKNS